MQPHPTISTDLHLHHELPKLRVSAVKMDKTLSSYSNESYDDNKNMSPIIITQSNEDENIQNDVDRTPTTKESKIPAILSCPPAPRKPKSLVSCKRKKMDEFQFFEDTNKEEMDAFFRSTFPKRSCPCT